MHIAKNVRSLISLRDDPVLSSEREQRVDLKK